MNTPVLDVRGNEITIQFLAELEVKSNAFHASKSMAKVRGGNPFSGPFFRNMRLLAEATNKAQGDIWSEVRAFTAANPMRYYVTSKRLEYVGA